MSALGAGFVRVSTGSQDESSQIKVIEADAQERGIIIVKWFKLHGYSASHGTQEPSLREAIADIERGDYTTLIVTESSRLDRREDLDAQAEILLAIRSAGGDIISIAEPQFGKTDFAGRIVTLVAQHANAEKSKTTKSQIYRGIMMIRDNKALFYGTLPTFWAARGERWHKQAYCVNTEAVKDIYERVANGEALQSIGRRYNVYKETIRNLVRFEANHTGVVECSYTYQGVTDTWAHEVESVVSSALWWRANKVFDANKTTARAHKGGRPVSSEHLWVSGILDCPMCGGWLYLNAGVTAKGYMRTPRLRCGGRDKKRLACRRFKSVDARPVVAALDKMFADDPTEILAFQRISGNSHELDALKAGLARIQGRLSATEDDDELDALITERKAIKASMETFEVIPDSYDYAPTGQTVGQMWTAGDATVKRGMVRAMKDAGGITLTAAGVVEALELEPWAGDPNNDGIVNLGGGLCFRRFRFMEHSADVWDRP